MTTTDPELTDEERTTLIDLAATDERIRILTARLDALPETAEVERLEAEVESRRRAELDTRRIAHDMAGTLTRLQSDAARLRSRRRDDIAGLRADTDRDRRRDLQHDLEVAERRLGEVEAEIAREERTLATFGHGDAAGPAAGSATEDGDGDGDVHGHGDGQRTEVDAALDRARAEEADVADEIHRQLTDLRHRSITLRSELSGEILDRYVTSEREQGIGAVELDGPVCRCCCIALDHATARRFANTSPWRLVSCPECGVLLIRPGAGL
ncbi:hypothetical protein [Corynebacterium terpenotabidum]|uniref:C4-type zinc ribbon domain-containing protein n=1 Tax=Corynebacterium terpenotabidum Y-11 TaxID=1200352 RepID=S4XD87_9CORY|nr:hypothetical protein [Corynebacterium terpenotabidum]AGP30511.1 hypothetical protein A606_04310 [Corynebacterium terpenotabidum Y-11]